MAMTPQFAETSHLPTAHRVGLVVGSGALALALTRTKHPLGYALALSTVAAGVLASTTHSEVVVADGRLSAALGPWRRTLNLRDVVRAEVVPVDVFRTGGFGVRASMTSVTLHLGQLLAVEVEFEGGDVLTLGTSRPADLLKSVRSMMPFPRTP
jgi:hypothetical protein